MNSFRILTLIAGLLGMGLLQTGDRLEAAEKQTVTGKLSLKKDKRNKVRSAKLTDKDGKTYTITMDKKGRELAGKDDGSEWVVEGTVVQRGKSHLIKIASFKAVEAKKPEAPPSDGVDEMDE